MSDTDERHARTADRGGNRGRRARQASALTLSLMAHAGIAAAIALTWIGQHAPVEPPPIVVSLVSAPIPIAAAAPAAAVKSDKPVVDHHEAAPPKPQPAVHALRVSREPPANGTSVGLSDADLAGAASADSGPGGGECNMARRLQAALRRDALVQSAVAGTGSRAIMVWNGDWVQSDGEDGKGLAALREAVMWEIGFAPPACKAQSMRGLITISLNASPGAARVALGTAAWRWSDLLATRESTLR